MYVRVRVCVCVVQGRHSAWDLITDGTTELVRPAHASAQYVACFHRTRM